MKNICVSTKGQAIILIAISILVLLALAGLAVDVGMAYGVKAKLNAAVDAAALAAGRVVAQGSSAASTQATNYFNANYPSSLLGATVTSLVTTPTLNADGSWSVCVTATANVPSNFAKVLGWQNFTVVSSATSTIRTLDLVLVLDNSGSMSASIPLLKTAATGFVANFDQTNDRIGMIHFGGGALQDVVMTTTKGFNLTTVDNAINSIYSAGATTSEEAMRLAKVQLDAIPSGSQSSVRAIVFFSDGAPNGVAGIFNNGGTSVTGALYSESCYPNSTWSDTFSCGTDIPAVRLFSDNLQNNPLADACSISTLPAFDYSGQVALQSYDNIRTFVPTGGTITNTRCNVNMAARNMLENVANAARSEATNPIHVFTIGLGSDLTHQEITQCGYGANEIGQTILQRLANIQGVDTYNPNQPTGLYAYAADATQLNNAFNQVASFLLRLSQ